MSENKTNGQIQIADEVVGVIATTAALEVEGVVAGGGKGFVELFGKKGHTKCAKITKDTVSPVRNCTRRPGSRRRVEIRFFSCLGLF